MAMAAGRAEGMGKLEDAAWLMTGAAHSTTGDRALLRGSRAFQACQLWVDAGRPGWGVDMARGFATDKCIATTPWKARLQDFIAHYSPSMGCAWAGESGSIMSYVIPAAAVYGGYRLWKYIING